MAYPHSGSILTDASRNVTRTGVSTEIIIQVDGNPIGAIQTISYKEDRAIHMIDEVGTDGHIDSVPQKSTDISGDCTRIRFDNLRMAAAFSRGYVHASSQRVPFDIVILDIFAADEGDADGFNGSENVITTVIKNVWIRNLGVTYTAADFVISETMSWVGEHIYSYLGQGNNVVPASSARQLSIIDNDAFERQADIGQRRGALDAAGLINVVEGIVGNVNLGGTFNG
jgi:hypothetical protein